MPEKMTLDQLRQLLPTNAAQPVVLAPQGEAFNVNPLPVPGYVTPSVVVHAWPPGASVLLIEAAGAVGKSAAAQALAAGLNAPLVRAESAQVGSYSLSGLVQDALGFAGQYVRNVATGKAAVVVDSLDEAHIRAGTQNFFAFLENVISFSGGPALDRQPSVVLFSRSETAELVKLLFADADVPLAEATLDFFDLAGANSFIESYLQLRYSESKRPEYNVHLGWPVPFRRLRDERFIQVARVLLRDQAADLQRDWQRVADFLGYTPVLIAIAESLAVTNPAREHIALSSASTPTELLADIIARIQLREQDKFKGQIAPRLQANLPATHSGSVDAESLYRPGEQTVRVAALITRNELVAPPPLRLPQPSRDAYETAALQFVAEHPFVRGRNFASVVFKDFVLAHVCFDFEARSALAVPAERNLESVGPFFTSFVDRQLGADVGRSVPENLVEYLLSSWHQDAELARGQRSDVRVMLSTEYSLLQLRKGQPGGEEDALDFEISDTTGAFSLGRHARDLTLTSEQGVILGTRGEHLTLGPNVVVAAAEIVVDAETASIDATGRPAEVVLAAGSITANHLQTLYCPSPSALHVHSPDVPPRLRPFLQELKAGPVAVAYSHYVDLRSILTSFGSSVSGGPAVYWEKLEQAIVKDNRTRQLLLEALKAHGVITKDGALYRLDLNALGSLGFNLSDIKSGEPSRGVLAFLARTSTQGTAS